MGLLDSDIHISKINLYYTWIFSFSCLQLSLTISKQFSKT